MQSASRRSEQREARAITAGLTPRRFATQLAASIANPANRHSAPMRTAGELIVDSLAANGIDRVFCVAGESYLGLLDALYGRADIDTVVCRHEAGAGFMAVT